MHVDIVFGPDIAIGNVHYGLLFSDRYSRMSYMYPLKNLMSDIQKQNFGILLSNVPPKYNYFPMKLESVQIIFSCRCSTRACC